VQNLAAEPEWKRPLGRSRRRWEDNIKMKIDLKVVDWIHLVQDNDRWLDVVNTIMNLRVA
jgi:hypothetical protein